MGDKAYIDLHVTRYEGSQGVTPYNCDIKELMTLLPMVDKLFQSVNKSRPTISYKVLEGSIIHRFFCTEQAVAIVVSLCSLVSIRGNIDCLDRVSAQSILEIQSFAHTNGYRIGIESSLSQNEILELSPATDYKITEDLFVDSEEYFYGTLEDAGGSSRANIHLRTKEYGVLKISTSKEFLKSQEKNILYKSYGVLAKCRLNIATGEYDRDSFEAISLIGYNPVYDEDYLNNLIEKATAESTIPAKECMYELRGYYE